MRYPSKYELNGVKDYGYTIELDEFFTCALSVDLTIFGFDGENVKVLLIKRGAEPYAGKWALPGDLMYPNENLDDCAFRVLENLTGISDLFVEQLEVFSQVNRHPVGRVITTSYYALVNIEDYDPKAASWADQCEWHSIDALPCLAFDHNTIMISTIDAFRKSMRSRPIGFEMLPTKFTLNDIQTLYEKVLDKKFDKGNFRKKILATKALVPLNESRNNVSHRPAKLFKLDEKMKQDSSFVI